VLLNNALRQTGADGPALDATSWRRRVRDRIDALDWTAVERDVAPLLEPGPAVALFGNLLQVLDATRESRSRRTVSRRNSPSSP
jgi:hypothetical protein